MNYNQFYPFLVEKIRSICEFLDVEEINKLIRKMNNTYSLNNTQAEIVEVYILNPRMMKLISHQVQISA
jgi:hypothetical protein